MTSRFWCVAAIVGATVACSSAPQQGFGGSGGDGTPGDMATGDDDGGTSASSSSGGSSSGGTSPPVVPGDAAAVKYSDAASSNYFDTFIPDAEVAQTITLTITPFTVAAGDEVFMCQQFSNPFGQDEDLVEMVGQMAAGSHHFFVFNMSPDTGRSTTAPIGACPGGGFEFHPFIYLSQQPNLTVTYPQASMGYPLPAANGLMMNLHYLNTTSAPLTASATITVTAAKKGVVTTPVGNLFLNNSAITVPANAAPAWYSQNTVPISDHDYYIIQSFSHMHLWATNFQAALGTPTPASTLADEDAGNPAGSWASPIYTTTSWSAPPLQYYPMPGIPVASGTAVNWQCYYNSTTTTLTFGDSAVNNVMCIYFGMYYPVTEDPTSVNYPDIVTGVEL